MLSHSPSKKEEIWPFLTGIGKTKTNLDFLEQETVSDSGIAGPYANLHLTPGR